MLLHFVCHQCQAAFQERFPVGEDLDAPLVQLHQCLGALLLGVGLHFGPFHGVSQAGVNGPGNDSRGDIDGPGQVIDLGVLLYDSDFVYFLGGLSSSLAASGQLQHTHAAVAVICVVAGEERRVEDG